MTERQLEIRAGAFLVAAIAAAAIAWMALSRSFPGSNATYTVDFAFAGGVPEGAAVKLAGVAVGKVRSVELRPAARDAAGDPIPVRVVVELEPEVARALRQDALFTVATPGPLGEASVELEPGTEAAPPMLPGATLRGLDPPRVDRLIGRLFVVLEQSARLLGEDKDALARFLRAGGGLAETVDSVLRERRTELSQGIVEISQAATELRALIASSNALVRGKGGEAIADGAANLATLKQELPELLARARGAAAALEKTAGQMKEEDWARVKAAVARLDKASEAMERISANADLMLKRIEKGEGTLGALSKDPKVYDDLRALLDDLRKHPWKMLWKE